MWIQWFGLKNDAKMFELKILEKRGFKTKLNYF